MRFSILVSVAVASLPFSVFANLGDDLRGYLAEHPGASIVSSDIAKEPAFGELVVPTKTSVIPHAYIVQLKSGSGLAKRDGNHPSEEHAQFHKRAAAAIDYDTRFEFTNPTVFFGLSIQVKDGSNASTIQDIPNVLNVWPVRSIARPSAVGPPVGSFTNDGTVYNLTATAGPRADVNSPHHMTEVDRLHALGIKGKGIKIAIMDTGVDYRHPALGGCFGEGCKFSFGKDFVGDDYGETGVPVPDDDPLATCTGGGHGSHVAGIISMQDEANSPFGLVGVAPEATMGMYRVFGCDGSAGDDVMLLAFQQAAIDKVDVLSISIGSYDRWARDDPFNITTAGLEAQGIAVVVANGNYGGAPAGTASPAIGEKVIAVGSVDNIKYPTVYIAKDSRGRSLKYSGSPWPVQGAPTAGLKVYDFTKLAANTTGTGPEGCTSDAWVQVAAMVEDKNNSIIAIPASAACTWASKLITGAAGHGFMYSLVYAVSDGDVFVQDYNTVEPSNPWYGLTLNVVDGQTLLGGLSKSDDYRLFFPTDEYESHSQTSAGLMSYFSSTGPTSDTLIIKPQFSAPGESILSTWPLEGSGYAILSGTSMATPYVTGSYALVKSQFPNASVQEIRERLQSTAKSIPYAYDSSIRDSVTQQGAGLIDVYNAIFLESAVSPSELNLGDLDSLKPQTITIENKSSRTKTYVITHEPAGEANLLPYQYSIVWGNEPLNLPGQYAQYAQVSFSADTVTIKGGESATVTATFTPPTDTPDKYLPVYSGFIKVTNNNDKFTITYLGQPYSRQKADYIDTSDSPGVKVPELLNSNALQSPIRDFGTFDFNVSNPNGGYPYLQWITLQTSQYFRIEMVPYNTTFVPDYYGFNVTESNPYGVPDSALPLVYPDVPLNFTSAGLTSYGIMNEYPVTNRPSGFTFAVSPYTTDDRNNFLYSLPDGDYRAVLRVLRWDSDYTKKESYQSWLSPVIRAARGK